VSCDLGGGRVEQYNYAGARHQGDSDQREPRGHVALKARILSTVSSHRGDDIVDIRFGTFVVLFHFPFHYEPADLPRRVLCTDPSLLRSGSQIRILLLDSWEQPRNLRGGFLSKPRLRLLMSPPPSTPSTRRSDYLQGTDHGFRTTSCKRLFLARIV
jgi:hypothetical protein